MSLEDALSPLSSSGQTETGDLRLRPGLRSRVAIVASGLFPSPSARLRTGAPHLRAVGLLGARLDRYVAEDWFVPLEAHGALAGDVCGYMVAFTGLGWSPRLTERLRLEALLQLGAGGGGNVHTGGGLLTRASVGASLLLTRELEAAVEAGPLIACEARTGAAGGRCNHRCSSSVRASIAR